MINLKKCNTFIIKLLVLSLMIIGSVFTSFSQTAANYTFTSSSDASLYTGTFTNLIAAGQNSAVSAVTNIGFTFQYETTNYTQFSVNSNGLMRLGGTVITSVSTNDMVNASNQPKIAPMWDNLRTGDDGGVGYLLTGTAPNRVLVVQLKQKSNLGGSGPTTMTCQVCLYETSNKIEFIYGAGATLPSATIGIGGITATNYMARNHLTNNTAASAVIVETISTWPGDGTKYTFERCQTASVAIAITAGTNPICSGNSVTFTATPTNGGAGPTYQWTKNGTNISGATSSTYTGVAGTDFVSTDLIRCVLTSNLTPCVNGSPATSSPITMTVNPILNASVAIAITSGSNPVCSGNSVTFTAAPTNGGAGPTYQWTKNGTNISGATAVTYSGVAGTDFVSTDAIRCVLTSNATPCLAGSPATSSPITMTVSSAAPTNVVGTYTSGTINHTDGTTQVYNYDNCITIGEITDAASGNVLGNTTMSTTVASSILTTNPDGYVYGRRSYSAAVASNGAATLKIFFTQADFDQYNANATNFLSVPTSGNNADPNKQFFRIATVVGGVHTISGSLGTSLNWNGNYWELTLPVTSINGAEYFFATMPSCAGVAVNNLAATNVTTDAVTATWSSVITTPTWGWYSFQYRIIGAPTWTYSGTANNPATSKFINGLLPGTNYEIQVRRHCSSQSTGPWSPSVQFTTLGGGCGSPMILNTPTVTTSSVTTTWTAVPDVAWYEFEYKAAASGTWINVGTLSASATSKLFSGLTAGTAYNFRGRTYCPSGTPSPWSIVLNATTTSSAAGCSLPPVITATTVNATNATISWPAVSGAAWYELRYSAVSASGPWTSGGTANTATTSKVYSGLTQNTTYYFQARTYCSNGIPSAWGATQFTTIAAAGCELPPVLTATTVLATTATITWPTISGASYFEYRYKQTVSGTWISAGTGGAAATSKTLTGLAAGTQHDFQARTFCANGLPSAWSTTLQFTTAMAMPLQPKPGSDVADDKAIDNSNIDVNVYPNPTSDLVNIETIFEEANTSILVKVIDMNGRIVLEMNTLSVEGKNNIQLSLENLNVGIYNLELYNNNDLIDRSKVIKTN